MEGGVVVAAGLGLGLQWGIHRWLCLQYLRRFAWNCRVMSF